MTPKAAEPLEVAAPPVAEATVPSPLTPAEELAQREAFAALNQQVYWQMQHAGSLVVAIRDHRKTCALREVAFRYGMSDPVPSDHPAIRYFLEHPNEYVVAPAEAITLSDHSKSALEAENAALKAEIAKLKKGGK